MEESEVSGKMPMSEEKKKYFAEYKKNNLKKLQADVNNDYYRRVKNICELEDISTTRFVRDAVDAALKKLEKKHRIDPDVNIVVYTGPDGKKHFRGVYPVAEQQAVRKPQLAKKIINDPSGKGLMVVYVPEDYEPENKA